MKRINISSGSSWEDSIGYSRAVRIGNIIEVSGTTAVDSNGEFVGKGDAYEQTKFILKKIGVAIEAAGASFSDVVRTRIYVTDISKWQEVGKAHGEVFSQIKPATAMVEVSNLIDSDLMVEIEATAVLPF